MLHALHQIFDKSPAGDQQAVLILHHQSRRSDNRRHDHSGQPVAGHTGNGPNANHPRLYSFDLICQAADCPLCLRDLWHFQRTSCQLRPDAFRHRGKKRLRLCFRQFCHGNGSVNVRRGAASVRCCGAEKGKFLCAQPGGRHEYVRTSGTSTCLPHGYIISAQTERATRLSFQSNGSLPVNLKFHPYDLLSRLFPDTARLY